MACDQGFNNYSTGLAGSALIKRSSRISVADEVLYIFMDVSHSFTFSDYIHPDYRQEFIDRVQNCGSEPDVFITKCRRNDGKYIDLATQKNLSIKNILFLTSGFILQIQKALIQMKRKMNYLWRAVTPGST